MRLNQPPGFCTKKFEVVEMNFFWNNEAIGRDEIEQRLENNEFPNSMEIKYFMDGVQRYLRYERNQHFGMHGYMYRQGMYRNQEMVNDPLGVFGNFVQEENLLDGFHGQIARIERVRNLNRNPNAMNLEGGQRKIRSRKHRSRKHRSRKH